MDLKITDKEKELLGMLMHQTTGDLNNNPECWAKEFKTEIVTINLKLACVGKPPIFNASKCNKQGVIASGKAERIKHFMIGVAASMTCGEHHDRLTVAEKLFNELLETNALSENYHLL